MNNKIGIIGLGFVGSAIESSFKHFNICINSYDKFKNGGIGSFDDVIKSDIIFLCLPTPYNSNLKEYDKTSIYETCKLLVDSSYNGIIVIKSTIEIGTISYLELEYPLNYVYNPEFLTARTAKEDFHNQTHIVLGYGKIISKIDYEKIINFYSYYYPNARISRCDAKESESMKLFCNCFYSVKIQFFNELYLLKKQDSNSNP